MGMQAGKLYEAKLKVEGLSGSGTVDFDQATVTVDTRNSNVFRASRTPQGHGLVFGEGAQPGVLSLLALDGKVVRSVRVIGPEPAVLPTGDLTKGIYVLGFQGEGKVPMRLSRRVAVY